MLTGFAVCPAQVTLAAWHAGAPLGIRTTTGGGRAAASAAPDARHHPLLLTLLVTEAEAEQHELNGSSGGAEQSENCRAECIESN